MNEFEKWWATTGYTEMDGPVPPAAAEMAWDAAKSHYHPRNLIKEFFIEIIKEIKDD